jgi:hypothetical protein
VYARKAVEEKIMEMQTKGKDFKKKRKITRMKRFLPLFSTER